MFLRISLEFLFCREKILSFPYYEALREVIWGNILGKPFRGKTFGGRTSGGKLSGEKPLGEKPLGKKLLGE